MNQHPDPSSGPAFQLPENWPNLCEYYLTRISRKLCREHTKMDEHLIQEAVENALLTFEKCPQRFHPELGTTLGSYIEEQSWGFLSNSLRSENRRHEREVPSGVFLENFEKNWKKGALNKGPADYLFIEEDVFAFLLSRKGQSGLLEGLKARLPEKDREKFELRAQGAPPETWAQVLNYSELPETEWRKRVNKEKNNLNAKLERLGQKILQAPEKFIFDSAGEALVTSTVDYNSAGQVLVTSTVDSPPLAGVTATLDPQPLAAASMVFDALGKSTVTKWAP